MTKSSELESVTLSDKITPELAEIIIELYTSGAKYGDIQRTYKVSHNDVISVLAAYGIPRREAPKKIQMDCTLPQEAFACYRGKCYECGWNKDVHKERVKRLRHVGE